MTVLIHAPYDTSPILKQKAVRLCLGLIECLCWKLFSDCGVQKTEVHKGGKKQS